MDGTLISIIGAIMRRFALVTLTAALVVLPAVSFAQTPAPSAMKHDAMKHSAMSHSAMAHAMAHTPKKSTSMSHGAMSHDAMTHSMSHASPKP
ncbi:MAG: pentapeptide MXKDX repeat protein [Vulcanimicrobiaceae bacterium]